MGCALPGGVVPVARVCPARRCCAGSRGPARWPAAWRQRCREPGVRSLAARRAHVQLRARRPPATPDEHTTHGIKWGSGPPPELRRVAVEDPVRLGLLCLAGCRAPCVPSNPQRLILLPSARTRPRGRCCSRGHDRELAPRSSGGLGSSARWIGPSPALLSRDHAKMVVKTAESQPFLLDHDDLGHAYGNMRSL